jgi:myo-inositol 2-dehydrogenase/D-chiro-inositol 1-dehydrogenase
MGRLHADNVSARVAGAELAIVVDSVEAVARAAGERYGVPWSTWVGEAVGDAAVDGVVIAAPTALHAELVTLAAAAGKHVLCEKPLGSDAEACRCAVEAAEAAGVRLQVGFQRRFDPGWRELERCRDDGELGDLRLFRCSHRNAQRRDEALGDLYTDVAVHDLDAARWLAGDVGHVSASATEGAAAITLRFETGALGVVDVIDAVGYGFECAAELVGSRATARATAPLARDHAERHAGAYVAELEHFASSALGGPPSGADGRDAIAALELAELARRSALAEVPA